MMQSEAKHMRGRATDIKLHAGGGIRFGFMRQNNLSGRTLSVTDVWSYVFDADSFISYQLRDEDTDINMIIADDDSQQTYLALSLALKEKWFSTLFSKGHPREWFRLKVGDMVEVATDGIVVPQGWLVPSYRVTLFTHGRKMEGNYLQRRLSELTGNSSDPFYYALLVSEDGEHAIEVEKYENGSVKIYATVYRPLSDITETTQFHRPYIVTKNTIESEPETTAPESAATTLMLVTTQQPEEVATVSDAIIISETLKEPKAAEAPEMKPQPKIADIIKEAQLRVDGVFTPANENATPVTEKPAPAETAPVMAQPIENPKPSQTLKTPEHMLSCDTVLAAHILDEAKRNKLSLEDIIRKVLGLPAEINDKIYIPFELSAAEQQVLAKRYGTDKGDVGSVQEKIVEELRQFAGIK